MFISYVQPAILELDRKARLSAGPFAVNHFVPGVPKYTSNSFQINTSYFKYPVGVPG